MTAIYSIKDRKTARETFKITICLALFVFAIYFAGPVKDGVIYGFKICVFNILPTLFPFFILSDLWNSVIRLRKDSIAAKCFESLFGINGEGMSSFVLGSLCGFPLGIKSATEKYKDGLIDKEELEALSAISNNPSFAFVISGVGMGLFSSFKIGIILYFSVLLSASAVGFIFKSKVKKAQIQRENTQQSFNLVESIKHAGHSSITVSSYIIFFSGIIGVIKKMIDTPIVISVISSFLEIGSACNIIREQSEHLGYLSMPLIAFSLGFSGLSVFLQAFSFLPSNISKSKYLYKKFLQGILSAVITTIFYFIM